MKKQYLIITFLSCLNYLTGQTIQKERKVVQLTPQQSFYLNGGTRSYFGGKSRTYFKIDLPPNTVEWYYIYTTTPNIEKNQQLNLVPQLMKLMGSTSMAGFVLSSLTTPTGSGVIDIFLMNEKCKNNLMSKDYLGAWTYDDPGHFEEGSVMNSKEGKVVINDIKKGTVYIGFRNPSISTGININFEAAAIVEEIQQQTDEQSQAITVGNLGWKAFERGDYDRCLELSNQALKLDNTLGFVDFNIALCYLVKGQTTDAISEYAKAISITRKTSIAKQTLEGARNDLTQYMYLFPSKADAQDILELINQELQNY